MPATQIDHATRRGGATRWRLLCTCLLAAACGGDATPQDAARPPDMRLLRCDLACPVNELCLGTGCVCDKGYTRCGGKCLDVTQDSENCGMCGRVCPANELCANNQCALDCALGLTGCNGRCTDLMKDATNCGACGLTCAMGQSCVDGKCK